MTHHERENLARRIVDSCEKLTVTLKDLKPDIQQLWLEFDLLQNSETILGCKTKTQFCERYLHVTLRAVEYMLVGGNKRENRGENVSLSGGENKEDIQKDYPVHCSLTPENIDDTRCLSMAKERLDYLQRKILLLVTAYQDPEWRENKNDIGRVLQIYLEAMIDFRKFLDGGVKAIETVIV